MSSRHSYALAPEWHGDELAIENLHDELTTDPDLLEKLRKRWPEALDKVIWLLAESIYEDSGDDE